MSKLTHIGKDGAASMVDVSGKPPSERLATAQAVISMQAETLQMVIDGSHKKGDVLAVARIAGIQAAKQCSTLIPLCHPLMLTAVELELLPDIAEHRIVIRAQCKVNERTGVEMEALTAAAVAALTIYDMCKAADRGMVISEIRLLEKSGGRSGEWRADSES
jgi:cyclic pyranopterin phosphate synthase